MSLWYVVAIIIAYLIGSINLSIILSKKIKGEDIRNFGSGNAGTTNTLRVLGKKAALCTLIFDILKGVVAVLIARWIGHLVPDPVLLVQLAAFAVILGHNFPVFYGFKGGKGVATSLGVILCLNWEIGLICLIWGVLVIAITKYVSLCSITAAILYVILVVVLDRQYILFAILIAALLIFRHRSNIRRLLKGEENKISFKKKD